VDALQQTAHAWQDWDRDHKLLQDATAAVKRHNDRLKEVGKQRDALLADAEIPVEGVGFTEDGLATLNGHPLSQASGREKIVVAMQAAVAKDPQLRTILIDEGNNVDEEGLQEIAELATRFDLQPILCRLGLEGAGELEVVDGWGPQPDGQEEEHDEETQGETGDGNAGATARAAGPDGGAGV